MATKKETKKATKKGPFSGAKTPMVGLGHREGTQAAQIVALLIKGATKEQFEKAGLTNWGRVKNHINHLPKEHGIKVTEKRRRLEGSRGQRERG